MKPSAQNLAELSYADLTRNTNESLKKIAHSGRLSSAARMVSLRADQKVLDYGCGDGGFFSELLNFVPANNLFGYEPYLLDQMTVEGIKTYDKIDALVKNHPNDFDVVFCMEVCEHLNQFALQELFEAIKKSSKFDGVFVFGVPIETGMPGFVKNIYRTVRGNRQNATFGRALKSLYSGYIPRANDPTGWIGSHIGFDCLYFQEQLRYGGFDVINTRYLPWNAGKGFASNEAYYICKRNKSYGQ
jgi:SAM-dependent methyltransferase